MEYDQLMKALGESFEIEDFEPGEDGRWSLNIDDTPVVFDKLPESDLMDIVAKVCDFPEKGGEQICSILLSAMAPGKSAEAFTFFVGGDKGIYLRRTEVMSSLDVDSFRQVLENFANALDEWRTSIGDFCRINPVIQRAVEEKERAAAPSGLEALANGGFMQV